MTCRYCGTTAHDARCDWCGAPTGKPKAIARRRPIVEPRAMTGATCSIAVFDPDARSLAYRSFRAGYDS